MTFQVSKCTKVPLLFGVFLVPCLHTVKGIKLRMDLTQLDKLSLALQSDILDDSLGGYLYYEYKL